jgi:hypothetical protein
MNNADIWIPITAVAIGVVFIIWFDWCKSNSCIAGL